MASGERPVLVIGATGQQGGAAARELLSRGWAVHALVRDPAKPAARALAEAGATLVAGDLDDAGSLRAAMRGVHGVFLVLTMMAGPRVTAAGVAAEERRGRLAAEVAAEAGVGHLVYSSIRGADLRTGVGHVESKARIEERIRELGLPATVLRPVTFMDNFATYNRPAMVDGELVVSLAVRPDTQLNLIAVHDIGVFAAIAFDEPDRFVGRSLTIAGDDLTGPQIAGAFARASGLPARFAQLPIEQLSAIDPELAKMFAWLDEHRPGGVDLAALREVHPGLLTLPAWLTETGWQPRPTAGHNGTGRTEYA